MQNRSGVTSPDSITDRLASVAVSERRENLIVQDIDKGTLVAPGGPVASVAAQQHALEAGGLVGPPALLAVPFSAIQPLDLLGSGEFCVVHCALLGGDYVALKRLKASLRGSQCAEEDLRREIELLSHTSHPNIVRFLAHGLDDRGVPFCCLELFSRPLSDLLPTAQGLLARSRQAKKWPLARGLSVGLQLARALRYCHDDFLAGYRLLHRDIKPGNIGVTSDGRVLLTDFGLATLWRRAHTARDDDEQRALTGMTGSLRYMAPEVALYMPYNRKAEAFSFTSVLYHVLSRRRPFSHLTPELYLDRVCRGDLRCPLGKWPAEVQALMSAGWASEPSQRPDFAQIVSILERALERLSS
mmetsp:Transcript_39002/g.125258  ORF Transcript_39002/g.125258 Transcript_39002/m.125258 type:complete len:357 (+) Transcript_39002:133-1203(+)